MIGLEFRVSFQRNAEPCKCARKGLVGLDLFVNGRCVHGGGTGRGHLVKRFFFVSGVALDGAHQLRHQIKTLLELHIDVCKCVFAVIAEFHQSVIHTDEPGDQHHHDNAGNNPNSHILLLSVF